jgi:hypothetical protein
MKTRSIRRVGWALVVTAAVAVLVSVASAAARPTPPPPPPRPPGPPPRSQPFHLVAVGPVQFACVVGFLPNCGGDFALQITGSAPAQAPHLGLGHNATFSTVEIATPDFSNPTGPVNDVDGNATVTATNGDTISIHYFGQSPLPIPDATGHAQLSDNLTFDIVGGTGRYEGASGGGALTASGDVDFTGQSPTIITSHLDGTITLPHPHPPPRP